MSSPKGLMASSTNNVAVQGETFLPGQIFVFGGFALRANSLGHLEQIKSYAPGRHVRFGSLNFTADICRDLIFDGFKPQPSVPHCLDGYDLALPPNSALEATPADFADRGRVAGHRLGGYDHYGDRAEHHPCPLQSS